jgi:hypothetical protein
VRKGATVTRHRLDDLHAARFGVGGMRVRDLQPHQETLLREILRMCRSRRLGGGHRARRMNAAKYLRIKDMLRRVAIERAYDEQWGLV